MARTSHRIRARAEITHILTFHLRHISDSSYLMLVTGGASVSSFPSSIQHQALSNRHPASNTIGRSYHRNGSVLAPEVGSDAEQSVHCFQTLPVSPPIRQSYVVFQFTPQGFEIASHYDKILLSTAKIFHIFRYRDHFLESKSSEDCPGATLRTHHPHNDFLKLVVCCQLV